MTETIHDMALSAISPSPRNPRQFFDEEALAQLAASIRARGVQQPIVLRPGAKTGVFEIVSGERRYRAAMAAGLTTIPAIMKPLNDEEAFVEAVVENVQRASLTPLEEARSFSELLTQAGDGRRVDTVRTIATRIGKPPAYVWDVAKLTDLVPDAQQLLERGLFSVRHAILLARLTAEQQKKAIAPPKSEFNGDRHSLLFVSESGRLLDPDTDRPSTSTNKNGDRWANLKARSVREFQAMLAEHVRFDVEQAAAAAPFDFGDVATTVEAASAQPGRGKKVIHITHDSYVQLDAKTDERVYSAVSWKRADGSDIKKAPTCPKSVLGVVVVGPGYGEAFPVCVNKDCEIHWAKERKERERRSKERDAFKAEGTTNRTDAGADQRAKKRQQEEEAARAQWTAALPALKQAAIAAVKTAKAPVLAALLFRYQGRQDLADVREALGAPKTVEALARHLALLQVFEEIGNFWNREEAAKTGKGLGIDVPKILAAAKKPEPEKPAKGTKGVCRECGCTETTPCLDTFDEPCAWTDKTQTLCSECATKGKDKAADVVHRLHTAMKKAESKKGKKAGGR